MNWNVSIRSQYQRNADQNLLKYFDIAVPAKNRWKTIKNRKITQNATTEAGPDQRDLGRARGVNNDSCTESGSRNNGLENLINPPSSVCVVWSGQYQLSGQPDQDPIQSLNGLIRALPTVWILWSRPHSESAWSDHGKTYGQDYLIKTPFRVSMV